MAKPPSKRRYESSTRQELSPRDRRGLRVVLIGLLVVFIVIVVLAFLVATGEITLR